MACYRPCCKAGTTRDKSEPVDLIIVIQIIIIIIIIISVIVLLLCATCSFCPSILAMCPLSSFIRLFVHAFFLLMFLCFLLFVCCIVASSDLCESHLYTVAAVFASVKP